MVRPVHRIEINRKATRVGTFEVCVSTHVSLRMFIIQVLASQLPFLANRNAELAVPPLFWPDTCIKIGGHVALLSGPTVYTLYCDQCNVSVIHMPKSFSFSAIVESRKPVRHIFYATKMCIDFFTSD